MISRQQGIVIGGGVLLGLACVGISVVFVLALRESQATKTKRDAAYQDLTKMYQAKIFPDDQNITQIRDDQQTLETWLVSATNVLAKSDVPKEKLSPSQFKSRLENEIREMTRQFNEGNPRVGAEFRFGFDKYKGGELPPDADDVMIRLNQQLDIIQQIMTQLVEAKIVKLDDVTREVFEDGGTSGQPQQNAPAAGRRTQRATSAAAVSAGGASVVKSSAANPELEVLFDRQRFGVMFQAHPEMLADVLNRLSSMDLFVVLAEMELKKATDSVFGSNELRKKVGVGSAKSTEDATGAPVGGQIVTNPESEPPVSVRLSLDVYSFKGV